MTKIQIKKLSSTVSIPKYETLGSSGMDIAAHIENNIIINPLKIHLRGFWKLLGFINK